MILTCPACDTKYVVKDDAIPPGGRQVRCASCKHSWHQDPGIVTAEPASAADIDFGGPPPADPDQVEQPMADVPDQARGEDMIAGEPVPEPDDGGQSAWGPVTEEPSAGELAPDEVAMEEAPAIADEWRSPPAQDAAVPAEEEFVGYAPIEDDEGAPRRRWPLFLGLVILIAAAAAAFWFFAPPEWKAKAGLADAGDTPLQLMITTRDRQRLESGIDLVVISGRIINSTDEEHAVPPIQAELRDSASKAVVHRWTIAAPTRVLGPGKSASFNSAEVDEQRDGEQLLMIKLGANPS
jgi:predicted Zn finger-like uncharacterized protein